MKKAKIAEIFKSIQGEGIYMGREQAFIRFFGCNLSCAFCDTPLEHFKEYDSRELREEVLKYKDYHSLCLTGGEPLCQAEFIRDFLQELRSTRIKVYLETNGTLADELSQVLDFVDIIAMDFKLPSSAGCGSFLKQHEEFFKRASDKDIFVKMVICKDTRIEDVLEAGSLIAAMKPDIAVILQPNCFDLDFFLLKPFSR